MNVGLMIVVIVLLIVMSGFSRPPKPRFPASTESVLSHKPTPAIKGQKLIMSLADNYDGLLSSILVGNNIVNISCTSVATVLFTYCVGEGAGPTVSTIVMTVLVLIFGEITPKSMAKEQRTLCGLFRAHNVRAYEGAAAAEQAVHADKERT